MKRSLHALVRTHLMAGDTPERHAERVNYMAFDARRVKAVRGMAEELYRQLGCMGRKEVGLNGIQSKSPRMNVRRIGGLLYGPARRLHCHAGVYRTRGANDLLTHGNITTEGNALVHHEHTIPSSLLVDLMWRMRRAKEFAKPSDLLAWLLRHSIVTVALQSERMAQDKQAVALNRQRTIDGLTGDWSCKHPDLLGDTSMTDSVRPFRRYLHTGVEITHWTTRRSVNLLIETMATHAARIKTCPLHDILTYYPEHEQP